MQSVVWDCAEILSIFQLGSMGKSESLFSRYGFDTTYVSLLYNKFIFSPFSFVFITVLCCVNNEQC